MVMMDYTDIDSKRPSSPRTSASIYLLVTPRAHTQIAINVGLNCRRRILLDARFGHIDAYVYRALSRAVHVALHAR